MKQQQNHQLYGSINEDTFADEETALVPRVDEEEKLYARGHTSRKYGLKSVFVALATIAAFAFLALSGASPLRGSSAATGGGVAGGPPIFDWKAYGANIKEYWAEKKADWSKKLADMKDMVCFWSKCRSACLSIICLSIILVHFLKNFTRTPLCQQRKTQWIPSGTPPCLTLQMC
jgi:hypothetical protein